MMVQKVTGRGTGVREANISEQNWAGDNYVQIQNERLQSTKKDLTIHIGRGSKTIRASELPKRLNRPTGRGMIVSSGRGTRSYLLQ